LNHGQPQSLQYVVNAAFLASLFADYMEAKGVPGWYCGPNFFPISVLKAFATSQVPNLSHHFKFRFIYFCQLCYLNKQILTTTFEVLNTV